MTWENDDYGILKEIRDNLNFISDNLADINNNLKKIVDEMYLSRVEKKE
jgi:hypothetical protein